LVAHDRIRPSSGDLHNSVKPSGKNGKKSYSNASSKDFERSLPWILSREILHLVIGAPDFHPVLQRQRRKDGQSRNLENNPSQHGIGTLGS